MFDLENSIKKWTRSFSKYRAFDHGSVHEMELHLRDHIDDLIAEGYHEEEAFKRAVTEFGEVHNMAEEEFWNIKRKPTLRSIVHTTMLGNYFKTSLRSMLRNPLSSFINVFGLAVAIGICLVVYVFFEYDHNLDQFHKNKNEVYLATFFVDRQGAEEQYGLSPAPLGKMLSEDFAQIKKVCRLHNRNVVMKYEDKVFHERVSYTDPEFLELFTFPLKWGLSSSLADINSIILSEEISVKYFGDENPVGEDILMIFGENHSKTFRISGVSKAFPKAHIIEFDFLINFENFRISDPGLDMNNWNEFVNATLIKVDKPSDLELISHGMEKYKILQNEVEKDWAINSFEFVRLADLHFRSAAIKGDISNDYNGEARTGLPIIAMFMLALACFNYINIAIVSAARRLKEIGLRKVIGAGRRQLVVQFLTENIFATLFALILGIIMGASVFIPWFSQLSGDPLEFELISFNLWIFLVAVLLFTGIASGIYPAFYISRFEAVRIFRGTVQFGKKNTLTKLFLGLQIIMTCAGITCAVIFIQNNTYQNNRSWGYDQVGALYAEVADHAAFEKLSAMMGQNPNVLSISGSSHHLGKDITTAVVHLPDRKYEVHQLSVDAGYFETMGIKLANGRFFRKNHTDDRQALVVNELLVKKMGIDQPIGQIFKIDSIRYEVVGVVKDFHTYNFYDEIRPTIFKVADRENYRYISLRSQSGSEKETYEALQTQWAQLFPEIPFQGGFQEEVWVRFFEQVDTAEKFYKVIASIAVLLASLGLYGLVSLNVAGRTREFSIRKVLGAGTQNITANIVNQYLLLFGVAVVIGVPFSYMLAEASLEMLYAYPMPVTYSGIIIASVILLVVMLSVISTQVRKVSKANPVAGLRAE